MTEQEPSLYDLILWGASGFTGRLVAEYLVRRYGAGTGSLRWAIAGRDQDKLAALRSALAAIDPAAATLPILLGDSHDVASLEALARQTRVICSTVGPYAIYGTPLVETCIRLGTDYCDLTGETVWIRSLIERLGAQATAKGVRIVHGCGFDSVPSDLGCLMLQEHALTVHGRPCREITAYLSSFGGGVSGGTLASMLSVLERSQDPAFRRLRADPYVLVPEIGAARAGQPDQIGPEWSETIAAWTAPFIMARTNTAFVHRTNALLGYRYGQSFRYGEAVRMGPGLLDWLKAAGMAVALALGERLGRLGAAQEVLRRWIVPALGEGPSREARERGRFTMVFVGQVDDGCQVRGRVAGQQDPGYGETAKMLAETALCLVLDRAKLPARFGILTPAAAMGPVLLDRLRAAGMTFVVDT